VSELLDRLTGSVHVVGASGAEGTALLQYLVGRRGLTSVVGHDFAADPRAFAKSFRRANVAIERTERNEALRALRKLDFDLRLRDRYLEGLDGADLIFASQNWFNYDSNLPGIPDAVAAGATLKGVVDLAMDLFSGIRVGVTGSNGKSTTSGLVAHLLGAAADGWRVYRGGNDRDHQAKLQDLEAAGADDRLVWEVSNRHLRDRPVLVDVAVLTNITRNHIEDHGSWDAYVAAKARLPQHATHAVLSATDLVSQTVEAPGTVWRFGARSDRGAWVEDGRVWLAAGGCHDLGPLAPFALAGEHNTHNLLAAVCAAAAAGASAERLRGAWHDFGSLPGRLEPVAEQDGVRWLYDIQATTAPAAEAGIAAIGATAPVRLIVGGEDKGMDFAGMADAAAAHARRIYKLPGTGADAFVAALAGRVPVTECDDVDAAVAACRRDAEAGDVVLLSPGCAFFFSRFLDGGPSFRARVQRALAPA